MASATTATNVAAASQYATNNGVGTAGSGGASGIPSSPAAPSQQQQQQQHQFPDMIKARLAVAAAAANSSTVQAQVCTTHREKSVGFLYLIIKTAFVQICFACVNVFLNWKLYVQYLKPLRRKIFGVKEIN
jgi:hypothetical protein